MHSRMNSKLSKVTIDRLVYTMKIHEEKQLQNVKRDERLFISLV